MMFERSILALGLGLAACGGGGGGGGGGGPAGADYGSMPGPSRASYESVGGESYSQAPPSPQMDTRQDRLATFSLDVDTASYTIMRRDLTAGRLPSPRSVRAEEYINFFNFDEPGPRENSDTPFAVHLEAAPSPLHAGKHMLRVGVRTREVPEHMRPATNLVFLVDVSGSMSAPNKLGLVQYSLRRLAQNLRSSDRVAIVTYAGSDAVVLPPTELSQSAAVADAINNMRAGGGTNGAAGIRTAYDLAAQHLQRDGINRVVLCTDGDFNVGLTGEQLIQEVEARRTQGITLSVFGFGQGNLNDAFMEQLADRGNGNYGYIDTPAEADRALGRDLSATLQVVAKDTKIQVEFNDEVVRSHRIVGYDNRILDHQDFANDQVDAAEVGAGDFVTAYLELELRDNASLEQALAEVRIRYKEPDGDDSQLRTFSMSANDMSARFEQTSASFRFGAAVVAFAELLASDTRPDAERLDEIAAIANDSAGQEPEQREFVTLVQRAAQLL